MKESLLQEDQALDLITTPMYYRVRIPNKTDSLTAVSVVIMNREGGPELLTSNLPLTCVHFTPIFQAHDVKFYPDFKCSEVKTRLTGVLAIETWHIP